VWSRKELAGLDKDDAPELARLLAVSRRPANSALLASLAGSLGDDTAPEGEGEDAKEVRRLLARCSRPRPRAILQLVGARLAAEASRGAAAAPVPSAAEALRSPPSEAVAPSGGDEVKDEAAAAPAATLGGGQSLPTLDSSILLVYAPGLRRQARALAQLISGSQTARPLSHPDLKGVAYLWPLKTRYFSAALWLLVVEDAAAAHEQLTHTAPRCGALVLLFDQNSDSSWETIKNGWEAALSGEVPEIVLVVGEGESEETEASGDCDTCTSSRIEWCLDHSAEYVRADFFTQTNQAASIAAAARGETPLGSATAADVDGMARVVEALQARRWTGVSAEEVDALSGNPTPTPRQKAENADAPVPAAESRCAVPRSTVSTQALPEPGAGPFALCVEEEQSTAAESPEEAAQDKIENLMHKMSQMRQNGVSLSDSERRDKAASLALELAAMLEDGEEQSDDDH